MTFIYYIADMYNVYLQHLFASSDLIYPLIECLQTFVLSTPEEHTGTEDIKLHVLLRSFYELRELQSNLGNTVKIAPLNTHVLYFRILHHRPEVLSLILVLHYRFGFFIANSSPTPAIRDLYRQFNGRCQDYFNDNPLQ